MKAAIYIRVSKKKQVDEGISLESQESLLRDYCKSKDYEVYNVYVDGGKSGRKADREAYLKLLNDAKTHLFDKVIIWRITRLGRNLKDLLNACDVFEKNEVALISHCENYDFSTPLGKLIRNIIGAVAEFEWDEYSENIRMVFNEKAKKGGRMCHHVLGYNKYLKDGFTINENELARVLKIYEIAETEDSILAATNKLNDLGITGKNGKILYAQSLTCILRRAMYCGYVVHNGKIYRSDNIPAIISVERYNKMQIKMFRNCKTQKNKLFVIIEDEQVFLNKLNEDEINKIIRNLEI